MSEVQEQDPKSPTPGLGGPQPGGGQQQSGDGERELTPAEQRRVDLGLAPDAPDGLVEAAEDNIDESSAEHAAHKEAQVLNFLLGPTVALEYDCVAQIDTPEGREPLTFHFHQLDDSRLNEIEDEHATGEGPFREVDRVAMNAAKVADATEYLEDKDGRRVEVGSKEFRGRVPDRGAAMRARFKFQPGILAQVAQEIDVAAGLTNDRVKRAERSRPTAAQSTTSAVGNS
jgi:hypothetical protein